MELLDILLELGVKATFFVNGNAALARPEAMQRMVDEGHEVGSHTLSHKNLTDLMELAQTTGNYTLLDEQIIKNEEVIFNLTGRRPRLLRPPYGAVNQV